MSIWSKNPQRDDDTRKFRIVYGLSLLSIWYILALCGIAEIDGNPLVLFTIVFLILTAPVWLISLIQVIHKLACGRYMDLGYSFDMPI
jgi:hypothetical protein